MKKVLIFICAISILSCTKKENIVENSTVTYEVDSLRIVDEIVYSKMSHTYEEMFAPLMLRHAGVVPVSIKLAQAILESSSQGEVGERAERTSNLYNITCPRCEDSEKGLDLDGKGNVITQDFKTYGSYGESILHHTRFLTGLDRYKPCLTCDKDYTCWAIMLKKCGYAEDPRYAYKLINIIEKYNLQQYDEI